MLCLFLVARIYFLVEEGHPLSKEPWHFSVQALLRAVLCLLRGGGRFLSNASGLALRGQELQLGPLLLSVRIPFPFKNHTSAQPAP